MNPFSIEYALFFIALIASVVLMGINAIAGVDHDHDVDHDFDHDVDQGHDGDGLVGRAFSALGVGRAPIMLVLLIFLGVFGSTGIILTLALRFMPVVLLVPLTHSLSILVSILVTKFFSSRLGAVMPKTESYGITDDHLLGCEGVALYTVNESSGSVQIRGPRGDIYKGQARTQGGEVIAANEKVIVVSCEDPKEGDVRGVFIVTSVKSSS